MAKALRPMHELQLAAPCSADWEQMPGQERVRRCQKCRLPVYRVSDLTRAEAEAVVAQTEGHSCPALYRRQDGTVLAQDCPKGIEAQRKASRWWKERVFHLFLLVLPWMILTGFIYLDSDSQRDGYYDIWDIEPFKSLDMVFGSGTAAPGGLKPLGMPISGATPASSVNIGVWEPMLIPEDFAKDPPPAGFPGNGLPEPVPQPPR
jgi:hypothetical protein